MATTDMQCWEIAKVEYENALAQYRHYATLRRQDIIFAATVQAVVLTVIGTKLLNMDLPSILLSVLACCSLLVYINSERRLSAYMKGYVCRAVEIEKEFGMSFLAKGKSEVDRRKMLLSNTITFPAYHLVFVAAWTVIWFLNIWK